VPVNRVERLIINLDTQMPLSCAWDDCPKRARTPYQVIVHEHVCKCSEIGLYGGRHAHYAFCSEGCKDFWLAATGTTAHETASARRGRIYGMHSAGMRGMNR
jgi:hypothetical protein